MSETAAPAADGEPLTLRTLEVGDYAKGYMQLLSQLTEVGDITQQQFEERWRTISGNPDYHILVLEDAAVGRIVGTASLIVEHKFIRGCGKCGHIEDVVVDASCRGKRLGQRLIAALCDAAVNAGCYKVILDCSEANAPFYAKCGLTRKDVQMVKYF